MFKPYKVSLNSDEQAKLVKLIENIRNLKVNGCDNELFSDLTLAVEVEGLEIWQWRRFVLRRDAESPTGLEYTLFYITNAEQEDSPKGLEMLLSHQYQKRITNRARRRKRGKAQGEDTGQGEATVTYTNGKKPNGNGRHT